MATSSTPGTRAAGGIVAAYETDGREYQNGSSSFKALAMAAEEKDADGLVWPDALTEEEFEHLQRQLRWKVGNGWSSCAHAPRWTSGSCPCCLCCS
jgi:hypothetical protein